MSSSKQTLAYKEIDLRSAVRFEPYDRQREVLRNMKRFTVLAAGKRFGKTILCAWLALRQLVQSEKTVWVVAPTYELTKRVWNYLIQWITYGKKDFSLLKYVKINKSAMTMETPWHSKLVLKSAENPVNLMGEAVDLMIVDEASRIPEDILTAYLMPCLTDRQGKAIFISTPFGRNWFYEWYLRGQEENENVSSFRFSTWDNPTLPDIQNEQEMIKQYTPEIQYRQEYLAEFVKDGGVVFRNIDSCINKDSLPNEVGVIIKPQDGHMYQMGVDLARLVDWTCLTVIDRNERKIVAQDRFQHIDWRLQKERIKNMCRMYNLAPIILDSTGVGDPIAEDLIRSGVPVTEIKFTNTSKEQLVQNLQIIFEKGEISFPKIPELIRELEAFQYQHTRFGRVTYAAADGFHDDTVMALALALWKIGEPIREMESDSYIKQYGTAYGKYRPSFEARFNR
jgi:hypothetical protein